MGKLKQFDTGVLILRISIGFLMLLHGIAKLKGLGFIVGFLDGKWLPSFLAYGVYVTEIIAPILILIGFRTRFASLVFAFGALIAILLAHSSDIFSLNDYGGWAIELIALYLFGAVSLFFMGAGKYAVSTNNKWD